LKPKEASIYDAHDLSTAITDSVIIVEPLGDYKPCMLRPNLERGQNIEA
jgi:hypothetical protein